MASLSLAAERSVRRIDIPAGTASTEPIVIELDGERDTDTEIVVEAGNGARATIVEHLRGGSTGGAIRLHASIAVAEGADITYVAVQQLAVGVRSDVVRRSTVGSGGRVAWNIALLGSGASTDELVSEHRGARAATEIAGLFFPTGHDQVQLTTEVRHDVPLTTSQTVVRAIAAGHGRGRYYGNIHIAAHAHGSDASLRDDTLLIGKHAKIDAIPALEIAANDVRAFHGATVGAIDEEHIFYLMSRGIERDAAEKLIALGFFEPALSRFPGDALRDDIRALLEAKLAGARR